MTQNKNRDILIQCKDGVIYTMGSKRINYRKNNGHGYYFFDFYGNKLTLFKQCRVNRHFYPFISYKIGTEVVNGETIDSELKKLREMGYDI